MLHNEIDSVMNLYFIVEIYITIIALKYSTSIVHLGYRAFVHLGYRAFMHLGYRAFVSMSTVMLLNLIRIYYYEK